MPIAIDAMTSAALNWEDGGGELGGELGDELGGGGGGGGDGNAVQMQFRYLHT